ncbi:MAG: polysaccharide deacetylase family protein [Bacillota bacterium]
MKNPVTYILSGLFFFTFSFLAAQDVTSGDGKSQVKDEIKNLSKTREVVITVDDLPGAPVPEEIDLLKENTNKLLKWFRRSNIPAIGFVNEEKLYQEDKYIDQRAGVLKLWLDNGMELGNHTFSHSDINKTPLEEFKKDIIKGEETVKRLLSEKGMKLRYFRHPFLHLGNTPEVKAALERFLSERGYTTAPVTIDNSEWIFAKAYLNAKQKGDEQMMKKIAGAYIPYMEQKFEYFEKQSVQLFGREISQVLLIHANQLNADYFGELAEMIKSRGYKFITLEEALKDTAYNSPDTYAKSGGITWIHRWAITKGYKRDFFKGDPLTPEFVMKEAGVDEE